MVKRGFWSFQSDTFANACFLGCQQLHIALFMSCTHHLSCIHFHSAFLGTTWVVDTNSVFSSFQLPLPSTFFKLNNAWQWIQANNYPHKSGASKCKTTATTERKSGLIIKMCQVQVQQLFLFNKPYDFIVWLAFLGHRLSLTQDLIKGTAFATKWRTISLLLTLPPCSDLFSQMRAEWPTILRLHYIEDTANTVLRTKYSQQGGCVSSQRQQKIG